MVDDRSVGNRTKAIQNIKNEIDLVEKKISNCKITANTKGFVNIIKKIEAGDYLVNGMKILSILPSKNNLINVVLEVDCNNGIFLEESDLIRVCFIRNHESRNIVLTGEMDSITGYSEGCREENDCFLLNVSIDCNEICNNGIDLNYIRIGTSCKILNHKKRVYVYQWLLLNAKNYKTCILDKVL